MPWLCVLAILSWLPCQIPADEPSSPNIIFIMADDLGYGDLACYGQKLIQTPNVDRLAAEGTRFTQAYAGSTVCAPSRGVLMTGLHNGHAPVRDNVPHYETYLEDRHVTIAEVLGSAGYRCGGIGKWSLGDPDTPGRPANQGFDSWLGYLNQDHAHYYYPEYLDDGEGRLHLSGNSASHDRYSHDLMTRRVLEFIRQSQTGPFFLYAAYTLPHFSSPTEDKTHFAVPSDAPYSDRPWSEAEKKYAAMVTLLDRDVGRIVRLIDGLGLKQNTLIIFTSDNGPWGGVPERFASGGPLRGAKRDLYEGGIRVPFIARWPGVVPENHLSDDVIAFWDMLPTFAELAGAKAPDNIDGLSVAGALRGEALAEPHDYLYWDYGHCRRRYDQAVRIGNWKGVRLGRESDIQLYDLSNDLGETNDLAALRPDVVGRMARIMQTAATPSDRYPIGQVYRGKPIWKPGTFTFEIPPVARPGDDGYLSGQFVFPPDNRPTPQCHASSIAETPSGVLVSAWFGGTNEPHVDNAIWTARYVDGKWAAPVRVVDGSEREQEDHRTGNPVLFQPTNGPLMLFYKVVPRPGGGAGQWWGMLTTSDDEGQTWSSPRKLGRDESLGESSPHLIGPVKNKPIQLEDGAILCPSSTEHQGWRVHFELTRDLGKTWEVIGPINDASRFNAIQPSILRYRSGRMQVLCRSREGVVAQSWSDDGGKSWSPVTATELPNPNSGTDAVTLADGRQLLVYNHTARRDKFPAGRNMLNVAVSSNGESWKPVLTLERDKGEFSYPAVIQTSDGKVHVTYTWRRQSIKHVVLDPAAIE